MGNQSGSTVGKLDTDTEPRGEAFTQVHIQVPLDSYQVWGRQALDPL